MKHILRHCVQAELVFVLSLMAPKPEQTIRVACDRPPAGARRIAGVALETHGAVARSFGAPTWRMT